MPRLAIIAPAMYAVALVGDFATGLILLAMSRTAAAHRSTVVLALAFLANATILLIGVVCLPLLPATPPMLNLPPQFAIGIFIVWHVGVALGAYAYVVVRGDGGPIAPSRRFTVVATACAVLVVAACIAAAYLLGSRLPLLADDASIVALDTSRVGPVIVLLLTIATILIYRLPRPTPLERALSIALLCMSLAFALFLFVGYRYSAAYYIGRILVAAGSLFVVTSAIRQLIAVRSHMRDMESTLSVVRDESAKRAGRFRSIWQIVSLPDISDGDRSRAILAIATAAMRPGKPILGMLSHQVGETLFVDATVWTGYGAELDGLRARIYPGVEFPLHETMVSRMRNAGRAIAWDDIAVRDDLQTVATVRGFASFIGIPIKIGGAVHFLSFRSPLTMLDEPYAEDDVAYVDVVASFFATRFKQEQQVERIKFEIEHDSLTGLANRAQFRNAVRAQISLGEPFALAFIDLDGFRQVNDRHGHQIGDEVLVEVACGLIELANGDFVARMSSDEFGIVLRGAGSYDATAASLRRYSGLFSKPFHTGDRTGTHVLAVGASIGATRFPRDGESAEDLMRRAAATLDVAKRRGGAATVIFDESMEAGIEKTRMRTVEFSDAIAAGQLAVVYQPTFDLATRCITGAEALVRWDHPTRGRLAPAEFVDFAERSGLIVPLSSWVFARVASDLADADRLPPGFRVYFNVAPQLLDDLPFITAVHDTLRRDPRLAPRLGVEVTETTAMQNRERSLNILALFRSWGIHVAIDDFGTGYSSLAYLKHLTVDVIKIDRSFISGLPDDERDGEIVEMLLRIISRFGVTTLAEGIETESQARWLLDHGCRSGQGYLIAKPGTFDELLHRLDDGPTVPAAPISASG